MKKLVYILLFAMLIYYGWNYYAKNLSKNVIKTFKVNDSEIQLVEKEFLYGKLKMYVPSKLEKTLKSNAINKEIVNMNPDEVYHVPNTPIKVMVQHTNIKITDSGIKDYKKELDLSLPQSTNIDKVLGNGIRMVNVKNIAYYEVATNRNNLYNCICFTEMQGKLLIIQIILPLDNVKEWRPVAKSMMNSITTN